MNDGLISMENVWYIDGESHSEVNANEFNGHFTTFRYFNTILKVLFGVKTMNDYRFADMTDIPHDCRDCKHNDKQWYEMPCDACCPAHCGFEKKEKNHEQIL